MELVSTHLRGLWHSCKFLCSMFSTNIQPFDFIKRNVIRKLPYKVSYITQINGDLQKIYMYFVNSRIFFKKLVGSIVNNIERIDTRKRNRISIAQCSKFQDNFHII